MGSSLMVSCRASHSAFSLALSNLSFSSRSLSGKKLVSTLGSLPRVQRKKYKGLIVVHILWQASKQTNNKEKDASLTHSSHHR